MPIRPPLSLNPRSYSGCPVCRQNHGYLNVYEQRWFICNTHKVKWQIGQQMNSSFGSEPADAYECNRSLLESYETVQPWWPPL